MRIRSPFLKLLLASLLVTTLRLLFATCRRRVLSLDPETNARYADEGPAAERFVVCCWHDVLALGVFGESLAFRRKTMPLISQHGDADYLATALKPLGYRWVRGSSTRGGVRALRELMSSAAEHSIFITPDGPVGPRREMKEGPLYLAGQMERRMIALGLASTRCVRLRAGWTDLALPLPFSTIYLVDAGPLSITQQVGGVSKRIGREVLTQVTGTYQQAVDITQQAADRLAAGEPQDRVLADLRQAIDQLAPAGSLVPVTTAGPEQTVTGDGAQQAA